MKISNGSKKRCREKFDYVGINKIIKRCSTLIEDLGEEIVISEFIYDHDDALTYNVFLFLLLENCTDEKLLKELSKFKYITNHNKIKKSIKFNQIK